MSSLKQSCIHGQSLYSNSYIIRASTDVSLSWATMPVTVRITLNASLVNMVILSGFQNPTITFPRCTENEASVLEMLASSQVMEDSISCLIFVCLQNLGWTPPNFHQILLDSPKHVFKDDERYPPGSHVGSLSVQKKSVNGEFALLESR
jgi:hypothetical protein